MLLSEPPNNKKENREKLIQLMIEGFDVRQVYLGKQADSVQFWTKTEASAPKTIHLN